jgi:hypothetical protein
MRQCYAIAIVQIVILILALLLLTGCHTYVERGSVYFGGAGDARWSTTALIGASLDFVEACIGPPTTTLSRTDGGTLVVWTASDETTPVSIPLSLVGALPGPTAAVGAPLAAFTGVVTAQVNGGAGRLMMVVDKHHIVDEIHMAGPADSLMGRNGLIGTYFLRGCRRDFERQHLDQ